MCNNEKFRRSLSPCVSSPEFMWGSGRAAIHDSRHDLRQRYVLLQQDTSKCHLFQSARDLEATREARKCVMCEVLVLLGRFVLREMGDEIYDAFII